MSNLIVLNFQMELIEMQSNKFYNSKLGVTVTFMVQLEREQKFSNFNWSHEKDYSCVWKQIYVWTVIFENEIH